MDEITSSSSVAAASTKRHLLDPNELHHSNNNPVKLFKSTACDSVKNDRSDLLHSPEVIPPTTQASITSDTSDLDTYDLKQVFSKSNLDFFRQTHLTSGANLIVDNAALTSPPEISDLRHESLNSILKSNIEIVRGTGSGDSLSSIDLKSSLYNSGHNESNSDELEDIDECDDEGNDSNNNSRPHGNQQLQHGHHTTLIGQHLHQHQEQHIESRQRLKLASDAGNGELSNNDGDGLREFSELIGHNNNDNNDVKCPNEIDDNDVS
ncbi:unnamed protein product [Hermetia illucens]|uniref:Uncharacterized protein n=1 Tax=Hermetia illucens TaxID=343691 RepID=A0A7R8YQD0_HERIL|nr:unnamed protein product [Hermetia illucens]